MAASSSPCKAMLFCPDCPHRSHAAGDWRRVETDRGVGLVCPDCSAEVLSRGAGRSADPAR